MSLRKLTLQPISTEAGVVISTVFSMSLLGVTLSCDFTSNIHIDNVIKSATNDFSS